MFSAPDKSAQAWFGLFVSRSLICCTFNAARHNDIGNGRRTFTPLRNEVRSSIRTYRRWPCCPLTNLAVKGLNLSQRSQCIFITDVRPMSISNCDCRNSQLEERPDMTKALIHGVSRLAEGERLIRSGDWTGWGPTTMLGHRIWGKRLGIVGMSRIGMALARRAKGFGL
jgi:hypothetical protein